MYPPLSAFYSPVSSPTDNLPSMLNSHAPFATLKMLRLLPPGDRHTTPCGLVGSPVEALTLSVEAVTEAPEQAHVFVNEQCDVHGNFLDEVPMLIGSRFASGKIHTRKTDGWETVSQPISQITLDLAV